LKLLFDANLSPKLVGRLSELFAGSAHVFDTGLARLSPDEQVWEYERSNGFVIVTADSDFLDLAERRGAPPKVVRLENCNYGTSLVERLIRQNAVRIAELERSSRPVLIVRNVALMAALMATAGWPIGFALFRR
jgi:predicted nuclease of predicted toxin-antitoxin system